MLGVQLGSKESPELSTGTVPVFMSRERIVAVKGNSLEEYFFSEVFETIAIIF
jgi:hypothetical protein